jgi:hypothetical protein
MPHQKQHCSLNEHAVFTLISPPLDFPLPIGFVLDLLCRLAALGWTEREIPYVPGHTALVHQDKAQLSITEGTDPG